MKSFIFLLFLFISFLKCDAQFLTGDIHYTNSKMLNTAKFKHNAVNMHGYRYGLSFITEMDEIYQSISLYYNGYIPKSDSTEISITDNSPFSSQSYDISCLVNTKGFDAGFQHSYGLVSPGNPFLSFFGGYTMSYNRVKFEYIIPSNYQLKDPEPNNKPGQQENIYTLKSFSLGLHIGAKYDFNKIIADISFGGRGRVFNDKNTGASSFPSLHLFAQIGILIPIGKRE